MNDKLIAIAAGTFAYGTLLGWAVTADHFAKKIKEKEDRVDDLRARNRWLQDRKYVVMVGENGYEAVPEDAIHPDLWDEMIYRPDVETSDDENPRGDDSDEVVVTSEEEEIEETPETEEVTRANLQKLIDSYTADPENQDTFVKSAQKSIQDASPPFVISQGAFSWDEEGEDYSKITVTYFPQSRVVLDDDDELMDDVGNTLGWRCLSQFGAESNDPDTVFIRNQRLMTDFEVVRDTESPLPLHVKYGMEKQEFEVSRAAGLLRLRDEDL